jgi:hypothetical protein
VPRTARQQLGQRAAAQPGQQRLVDYRPPGQLARAGIQVVDAALQQLVSAQPVRVLRGRGGRLAYQANLAAWLQLIKGPASAT